MNLILGKRDYEKTTKGKYPKYDLEQLNRFIDMDYPTYSGLEAIFNIKSFDLFGKYQNKLNQKEKDKLDIAIKDEYGMHNIDINHFIDWNRFYYDKNAKLFKEIDKL